MTDDQEEPRAPSAIIEDGRRWGAGSWAFLAAGIMAVIALLAALTLWGFSSQATVDRLRAQVAREQGEYDELGARYDELWAQYEALYQQAQGSGVMPDTPDPADVPEADELSSPPPQGPAGAQGARGPAGPPPSFATVLGAVQQYCGPPSLSSVCSGPPGAAGSPGAAGEDGSDGAPGVDGAPGADGVTGASGPPGERGLPGRDGVDGAQGPMGPMGPQGPVGPAGPVCPPGSEPGSRYVPTTTEPLGLPTPELVTLCIPTSPGG